MLLSLSLFLTANKDRGVGNKRGVVGNSVGNGVGSITSLGGLGVDGGALIGDRSGETVVGEGAVGGGLDSAVGKGNGERTGYVALSVLGLGLLEVGLAVVISNSVFVGEGLGSQLLGGIGGGCAIGWGSSGDGGGNGHKSRGEDNLVHCEGMRDECVLLGGIGGGWGPA